jgi:hypothetical protein
MTIAVANIDVTTDSVGQWITKTNVLADALSNKVVTTNSNTATGNAGVSSAFSANALYANTLSGGNNSVAAALSISTNTSFAANVAFNGYRTNLGLGANVVINSGNSTFRVLTVNSAASNTLVATKLTTSDLSDVNTSSVGNGQVLVYSSGNSYWYNSNVINLNANTSTVTFSGNIVVAGVQYTNGQSFSSLVVYYANGTQAFPA